MVPAEAPGGELVDRIREAALRLFNERGYGSATVDAIAQAAGVGVGTLYRRWPDKPALANDVFHWVEASIIEAVSGTPLTGSTPEERFRDMFRRVWDFTDAHPDRVVFVEGHTHEAFLDDANRRMKAEFLGAVGDELTGIGIRATPDLAVSMVTGTLVHLARTGTQADPDDLGARLWTALSS